MENHDMKLTITPATLATTACDKIRREVSKLIHRSAITTTNGTIHIRLVPRSEKIDILFGGASDWKYEKMFEPCSYEFSFSIVEECSKIRTMGEERWSTAAYAVMQLEYGRLVELHKKVGDANGHVLDDLREINGFATRDGYFNVMITDPQLPEHNQEVLDVWVSVMAGSAVQDHELAAVGARAIADTCAQVGLEWSI